MVLDGLRGYLQLASGLTDVTRERALAAAKAVAAQGAAGVDAVVPAPVTTQVSTLTEDLLAASKANRALLLHLVQAEIERSVARLGLVSAHELDAADAGPRASSSGSPSSRRSWASRPRRARPPTPGRGRRRRRSGEEVHGEEVDGEEVGSEEVHGDGEYSHDERRADRGPPLAREHHRDSNRGDERRFGADDHDRRPRGPARDRAAPRGSGRPVRVRRRRSTSPITSEAAVDETDHDVAESVDQSQHDELVRHDRCPRPADRGRGRPAGRRSATGRRSSTSRSTRTCTGCCRSRWPTRTHSSRPRRRAAGRLAAVTRRARLDAELVRRGLARSREQAAELVAAGQVRVPGRTSVKAATQVALGDAIVVAEPAGDDLRLPRRAQAGRRAGRVRGRRPGRRGPPGAGRRRLHRRLHRRAAAPRRREVVGVDVGYGQLAWSLQTDDRVTVLDRTNVRDLTADAIGEPVDLVVADLSFISLRLVLPALVAVAAPDADLVLMVKPQFEVGRERARRRRRRARARAAGRRGRRRSPRAAHEQHGLGVAGVTASPLPGPAGNVEYFLWLRRDAPPLDPARLERGRRGGTVVTLRRRRRRSVLLVGHTGRDEALRSVRDAAERFAGGRRVASGCSPTRPTELGLTDVDGRRRTTRRPPTGCELVVVLGGDGTLLRGAELARPTSGAAARRQPRPRRLPRRGRAGRPGRDRRPGGRPRATTVEERMTLDVTVTTDGDVVAPRLGAERGVGREGQPASGCSRSSSRSTAARCPAGAATGSSAPRRPARRRTRSRPAARWSGPRSRRCCWCRSARTRCSPGRWWSRRTRCSPSRCCRPARAPGCCGATAAGRSTCRRARGSRSAGASARCGWPGCTRRRSPTGWWRSSPCRCCGWRGPARRADGSDRPSA